MDDGNLSLAHIRNIGLIAHIDAGKTTTTERILFYSGRIHRMGEVDEGTTTTDWMEQERERGITITAASITTSWKDTITGEEAQINIIDTPGHIDFTAEVQRSLRVLDGCVVIFDAVCGVEPQSETVWRQADQFGTPRICFVNKMDRMGADFWHTIRMIEEDLRANPIPLQIPIGVEDQFRGVVDLFEMKALVFSGEPGEPPLIQPIPPQLLEDANRARLQMLEKIIETDPDLTEKFIEGGEITNAELYTALRRAVIANTLSPVLCGSSLRNIGVQPVLDAIVRYLPNPLEMPLVQGVDPQTNEPKFCQPDPNAPFCGLVFKVVTDQFVGRLVYVRVYSGTMRAGSSVYNATRQKDERVSRLLQMMADKRNEITECHAGDIAAVVGLRNSFTGDTLCERGNRILLEQIEFPAPVVRIAVEPKYLVGQDKLNDALQKLKEEDPTFNVAFDEDIGQTIISGMGELHLEIIIDRLKREFNVECNVGAPQVAYHETITQKARAEGRYIHQTGGRGQYGVVVLEVEPGERGSGLTFINQASPLAIPPVYIPSIQLGVQQAMESGVLASYPAVDIKVTVVDGKYHEVDSSKLAYEIAAGIAFREACKRANPILLEPIMKAETRVLEDYVGSIVKDFNSRRGSVEGIQQYANGMYGITAFVPLSEMFGYVTSLRSLTSGRGTFTMQFDHYAAVPQSISERILGI